MGERTSVQAGALTSDHDPAASVWPGRLSLLVVLLGLLGVAAGLTTALAASRRLDAPPEPEQIGPPSLSAGQAAAGDLQANTLGVYLYAENDLLSPASSIMASAGARWTRSWLSWDSIEPIRIDNTLAHPATFHWQDTDARLLAARQAGLEPIFLLGGNASWAADSFCGPLHPDAEPDFQRFLRAAVVRYSAEPYRIRLWEIYNEPDSVFGSQGFCFGTRGHLYPRSLKLAYEAIKAADPNSLVLFGGISYDFFTTEGGAFDPNFLDDALAAGAGPYFDILAFHYYPAFAERWEPYGPYGLGVAGKAAYLRQELARYGLDKPLALTEIGQPTRGPDTDPASYNEIATARFVAPALASARMAALAPIIWFTAVDKPNEPYDYGLLDAQWQAEPSFAAYRTVLAALQGADFLDELPVSGPGGGHALRFGHRACTEGQTLACPYERIVVMAWSEPAESVLTLATPGLWRVDRQGVARWVADGGPLDLDQARNDELHLQLTIDPLVLWLP